MAEYGGTTMTKRLRILKKIVAAQEVSALHAPADPARVAKDEVMRAEIRRIEDLLDNVEGRRLLARNAIDPGERGRHGGL